MVTRDRTTRDRSDFARDKHYFLALAIDICLRYGQVGSIPHPYKADVLQWHGINYYYVYGYDLKASRRLLEVFRLTPSGGLEALFSFQYPPPFRDLFPEDYGVLHSEDPWEGAFPPPVVAKPPK